MSFELNIDNKKILHITGNLSTHFLRERNQYKIFSRQTSNLSRSYTHFNTKLINIIRLMFIFEKCEQGARKQVRPKAEANQT